MASARREASTLTTSAIPARVSRKTAAAPSKMAATATEVAGRDALGS
jgi:hypothetical protein